MTDDAEWILILVLFATVFLRLLLVAVVVWLLIPRRRTCPHCAQMTDPIAGPAGLKYLLLERRWCMGCGWNGVARKARRSAQETRTVPTVHAVMAMLAVG